MTGKGTNLNEKGVTQDAGYAHEDVDGQARLEFLLHNPKIQYNLTMRGVTRLGIPLKLTHIFLKASIMNRNTDGQAADLIEQARDVLHATKLNLETIGLQLSSLPNAPLQTETIYLKGLLQSLDQLLQTRPEHHLDYLITKQIQEEEENVRRERMADYEEKIYDQRRIISDKEVFFENLLRPKKKRAVHQTMEEFQEIRVRQKQLEERLKIEVMNKEYQQQRELRRNMEVQLMGGVQKKGVSDSTAVSVPEGVPSQNTIPIEYKRTRTFSRHSRQSHSRTSSLQSSFARESSNSKGKEKTKEDKKKELRVLLEEIVKVRQDTEEVVEMYEQQTEVVNFKQSKYKQLKQEYEKSQQQFKSARKQLQLARKASKWHNQFCSEPVPQPRQASLPKS